jgi:6-phosphogluconolactonase
MKAPREHEGDSAPYELEGEPKGPPLPGAVVVRRSVHELCDAAASDLYVHALNCVRAFGDFHLAIAGGAAPEALCMQLMYDPHFRDLAWARTHLWTASERRVDFDDDASTFKMLRETIVDHSDLPAQQFHPIFPLAGDAAERYEAQLRETLGWREKGHDRLDYALLALGADGSIAGIAPGSGAAGERERLSIAGPEHVSLTLPMLNATRLVAVLVTGADKRDAVVRLARAGASAHELPAAGLKPLAGELRWYVDAEACG